MENQAYDLSAPLPSDVTVRGFTGFISYRKFPVFSWPWFLRRSLIFGSFLMLWGIISQLSLGFESGRWLPAGVAMAYFATALSLCICVGPALATLIRHARFRISLERSLVVLAILLGVALARPIDLWASAGITRQRAKAMKVLGLSPHSESPRSSGQKAQGLAIIFAGYFFVGGGFALSAYFSEPRRWERARRLQELEALRLAQQRSEMRLTVLQAQVEPHFLFNALASVRSLVKQDPDRAEATIDALAAYLRAAIPKLRASEEVSSTLAEQFALCESYLNVMAVRMGDRLTYELHLPEDLAPVSFPALLLISLVENAIKHGLEPKLGPGRVEIRAQRDEAGLLLVSVVDDGVGLKLGLGSGVGLANIRDQLITRYGEKASLELSGGISGGVKAVIRIPAEGKTS